jgi:hypothetical protein
MNLWPLCALALLALADDSSSWKKEVEARIETHRATFTRHQTTARWPPTL